MGEYKDEPLDRAQVRVRIVVSREGPGIVSGSTLSEVELTDEDILRHETLGENDGVFRRLVDQVAQKAADQTNDQISNMTGELDALKHEAEQG